MLSILFCLLSTASYAVSPFVTAELSPFSRADLTWVEQGQDSDLLVGEFDGFVNPSLKTHVGLWLTPQIGLSTHIGMARTKSTVWYEEDLFLERHWSVIRPGLDLRYSPWLIPNSHPQFWLLLGAYIDLASSRDVSNGYTESEQEEASILATSHLNRLKGHGGRLGFCIEQRLNAGLSLGFLATTIIHRSSITTETTQTVSTWTTGDASLLISFDWPRTGDPSPPSDPPKN